MAHIEGSGSGRKSNFEVNLVPFIDLMSVLIIFLLLTAVWTQVSMIQIGTSIYGKRQEDKQATPPPIAEIPFRLDIRPTGYQMILGKNTTTIPKAKEEYDTERLKKELRTVKELYPEKEDCVVTMTEDLPYVELIHGMDILLGSGFPEISIATGGAK